MVFFNGTVDTCCKAITFYISILETARERERGETTAVTVALV